MNLAELNLEVRSVVRDPTIESSINTWINDCLLQLAFDFDPPQLRLRTPATLAVTTAEWLYDLSAATHDDDFVYLKKVFRATSTTFPQGFCLDESFETLDDLDPEHDDTGDHVERIALEGDQLGIFPMATENLSLWFARRPFTLTADSDTPDWIPDAYHTRVIIPSVILRAFRVYPDLASDTPEDSTRALTVWERRRNEGIYGNGSMLGWVHSFHRQRRPRLRGASPGMNLSGADTTWRSL